MTIKDIMDEAKGGAEMIEDNELCQFTGLSDKNGKEIYEGDILRIKGIGEGIIVFDKKKARFMWNDNAKENWGIENNDEFNEIIGNIYENPELLK